MRITDFLKDIFGYLAAVIIFVLFKLCYLSCKKEWIKSREFAELQAGQEPYIYSVWHGRLSIFTFEKPKHRRVFTIVSRHGDGELIARVMGFAGLDMIRGSTNRKKGDLRKKDNIQFDSAKDRGGSFVIRESIRTLRAGHCVAITPDGPKGPKFIFKRNFLNVVALSGAPIVPATFSASRAWVFPSWDRFMIPKPFARIKIIYGVPVRVARKNTEEELEKYAQEIESSMKEITAEADNGFGIKLKE